LACHATSDFGIVAARDIIALAEIPVVFIFGLGHRLIYTPRMRHLLSALALMISLPALAQVGVEIALDQDQFLRSESMLVRVRISNFAGQPLRIGTEPEWLTFTMQDDAGKTLDRVGNIPLPKAFTIESARTVSLSLDLMPYFKLSEAGRFSLGATVRVPSLEKEFSADPKWVSVVSGLMVWEREFGVPGQTPPEVRKYALQQATFLKQPRLYARVTDAAESKVFRVTQLGPIVSFTANNLETQLDKSSNLHVLFQSGANNFVYCAVATDGTAIIRQAHEQTTTRPHLKAEDDGRVVVHGGQRKILLSDLPPPRVAQTNDGGAQ
jgi:hypothetical protein